jgi:hypothetical protein
MKLMATFVSKAMNEEDETGAPHPLVRHVVVDCKALGMTPSDAKIELRRNAFAMARKLGLGKEGEGWDIILSEVHTTSGKQSNSGLVI